MPACPRRSYPLPAGTGSAPVVGAPGCQAPVGGPNGHKVVGIGADTQTGGYWLVDSRGQVYTFYAGFLGSVPSVASEHGVTGVQAAPGGTGYRLVDSGGALFCFGTSPALGSARTAHPHRAVVGISAP